MENKQVYISDHDSKFGTFVMIRRIKKVQTRELLPIQIERKCFFIKLEEILSGCAKTCSTFFGQNQKSKSLKMQ
jgi:hypothetical protein